MKNQTLIKFVINECADYDKHYRQCVWDKPCKVLIGERCGYFEKAVLGPPDYKYQLPAYDYQKLFAQYADQTGAKSETVSQRLCTCGNPLRPRQRFCDDCACKKRKDSNRKYNRNRAG